MRFYAREIAAMAMRNTTECQQRLIQLGYLPATYLENGITRRNDDGVFGAKSVDAYNRYRKVALHKEPVVPPIHLDALNADLFPEEQPPIPAPKPRLTPNPVVQTIGAFAFTIFLQQLTKGLIPMNFLSGYKTYIIAFIMILLAIAGLLGWAIPGVNSDPGTLIIAALGLITGRTATAKVANNQ